MEDGVKNIRVVNKKILLEFYKKDFVKEGEETGS